MGSEMCIRDRLYIGASEAQVESTNGTRSGEAHFEIHYIFNIDGDRLDGIVAFAIVRERRYLSLFGCCGAVVCLFHVH